MAQISISLYVTYDEGRTITVADHMAIGEVVQHLLQELSPDERVDASDLNHCTITVSRQIIGLENLDLALNQLGVRNGDALSLIIHQSSSSVTLVLDPMLREFQPLRLKRTTMIGREQLQVYLPYGDDKQRISSEQVSFEVIDGVWSAKMIGRTPMFINGEHFQRDQTVVLHEEDVIAFGNNPARPLLRLAVGFQV